MKGKKPAQRKLSSRPLGAAKGKSGTPDKLLLEEPGNFQIVESAYSRREVRDVLLRASFERSALRIRFFQSWGRMAILSFWGGPLRPSPARESGRKEIGGRKEKKRETGMRVKN